VDDDDALPVCWDDPVALLDDVEVEEEEEEEDWKAPKLVGLREEKKEGGTTPPGISIMGAGAGARAGIGLPLGPTGGVLPLLLESIEGSHMGTVTNVMVGGALPLVVLGSEGWLGLAVGGPGGLGGRGGAVDWTRKKGGTHISHPSLIDVHHHHHQHHPTLPSLGHHRNGVPHGLLTSIGPLAPYTAPAPCEASAIIITPQSPPYQLHQTLFCCHQRHYNKSLPSTSWRHEIRYLP